MTAQVRDSFFVGKEVGKGGKAYGHRVSLALETQHFPDSPNRPEFPSTARPGGGVLPCVRL